MFTGIIEEIGKIKHIDQRTKHVTLTIQATKILEDTKKGDSISTNGVCLTVTDLASDEFKVDMIYETLNRTTMKELKIGSKVNLERALTLSTRLGGHMVSGHIDGIGRIENIVKDDRALVMNIKTEPHILKYIIEKGSVAIDGISLTVVDVHPHSFQVSIIPHTQYETILIHKKVNDIVNIECDLIGKYVEKLIHSQEHHPLTEAYLKNMGY